MSARAKLALRIAFSLGVLGLALAWIDWRDLVEAVASLHAGWLAAAIVSWIAQLVVSAAVAAWLLEGRSSTLRVLRVNLISSYFVLFVPGDALAGLMGRLRYLGLPSWRDVAVLTLAERGMQVSAMGLIGLALYGMSGFAGALGWAGALVLAAITAAGVAALGVLTSSWVRRQLGGLLARLPLGELDAFRPAISPVTVLLACVAALLSGLTNYLALRCLNADISYADALIYGLMSTLAQALPFFFAGIGIRDVTALGLLGMVGVASATALASSALGLVLLLISAVVGGVLQVLEERRLG